MKLNIKYYSLVFVLICLGTFHMKGQEQPTFSDKNYVHEITPQLPLTIEQLEAFGGLSAPMGERHIQNVQYYDGLGRQEQNVSIGASPAGRDINTYIEYDEFGRVKKEWLPYPDQGSPKGLFKVGAKALTSSYYGTGEFDNTQNPYSEKEFEPSPLNRVTKQAAPGNSWALSQSGDDHAIEFAYGSNTATEVLHFEVQTTLGNGVFQPELSLHSNTHYNSGELFKTTTYDENHVSGKNHSTEEFKNKKGQVLLKRTYANVDLNLDGDTNDTGETAVAHDTYYVYDDFGNLSYVIPPKVDTSDGVSDSELDNLGYQYVYDQRNRLVIKKIPSKGREFIIYNALDQPIMTQDSVQRLRNEWLFTKYDAFGRVAYTGKAEDSQNRQDVQDEVDGLTGNTWVSKGNSFSMDDITVGYQNTAYPTTTVTEILTVNYYDDYAFGPSSGTNVTAFEVDSSIKTKGLATGSRVKVLDVSPAKWIVSATYYDDKSRPIYTHSENTFLGTVDVVTTRLDFSGKPMQVRSSHSRAGNTVVTLDNFTYDQVGRLMDHTQCIGGATLGDTCPPDGEGNTVQANLSLQSGTITTDQLATESITLGQTVTVSGTVSLQVDLAASSGTVNQEIVSNTYDELGRLIEKEVGGGLQTVNYGYNVRGWLTSINQDAFADNDLFDFGINYHTPTHGGTALYNGNIAETQWKTANDNTLRWYRYGYDALNRIENAIGSISDYNLVNVDYDKMGNITALERRGHTNNTATSFGVMDKLTYTYASGGNQLTNVADNNASDAYGFIDVNGSGTEYTYDANGNMLSDVNKGITNITYNHLNLPTSITMAGGTIYYIYDATGAKLQKTVGSSVTTYAGNYMYQNDNLEFFNHLEGYVNASDIGYSYVYQYKDHLGNVRLSYTEEPGSTGTPTIIEESNYYPFGLTHKGYNVGGETALGNDIGQKYKTYQGQELTENMGYNKIEFKWRHFDPAIGRFNKIDRYADKYTPVSPYSFIANNPLMYREVQGDSIELIVGKKYTDYEGKEHPYGHVALRVFNSKEGYDYVFDFGRYGNVHWNQTTGDGILNVWDKSVAYFKSEQDIRESIGYTEATTAEQDKKIINYYKGLISSGEPFKTRVTKANRKSYKLTDDYDVWDNNCCTVSNDGLNQIDSDLVGDEYDPRELLKSLEENYKELGLTRTVYKQGGVKVVTYEAPSASENMEQYERNKRKLDRAIIRASKRKKYN